MMKKKFPSENEWDKIVSDAFSSDETHVFSKRYNAQKYQMQRSIAMKRNVNKKHFVTAFIAAAAVFAIVPTSVYAYNVYTASISKTAKYQNTVKIENSNADKNKPRYDSNVPLMKYELGWLPDGFTIMEGGFKYHNENDDEGITPIFFRLPDNKRSTEIDMPFSAESETYVSGDKTAMINYRISYNNGERLNFGREIWVSFNDTSYLLQLYITDGISKEDTKKMIDNIRLVETDEVCFSTYLPWEEKSNDSYDYSNREHEINKEKAEIYNVGDTISYENCFYDDDSFDITLNSFELTDSFDGIHTDGCGWECDYSELMDENGNIAENTRIWTKLGDGINTLDEVIKEEKIPMHILKLNLTFTNTSNKTNEIIICPNIMQFIDGVPTLLGSKPTEKDIVVNDSIRMHRDVGLHFSFDSEKKSGKNYVLLEPGESTEVNLAFFVADDETDNLYTYFQMSGDNLSYAIEHGDCPLYSLN